jgi:hypothetical protein
MLGRKAASGLPAADGRSPANRGRDTDGSMCLVGAEKSAVSGKYSGESWAVNLTRNKYGKAQYFLIILVTGKM